MQTIRTFTAFGVLDSNVNITVELIRCDDYYEDYYEVSKTISSECTCDNSFTITRRFSYYSTAKNDYDNEVHVLTEFA